ncbi:AMP-binding protein [Herminiimonas aquatilis]|uniref:AMP-binding protein n=1 Tax=Herminiimonas aquatilis TaxID=345342 RepID=A0ABW2J1X4_9BURK
MHAPLINLASIAAQRPADFIIGWRDGKVLRNDEFVLRMHAWHALLQRTAGQNFALYIEDSIEFGAALLGAWQAGKTVWLTADTLAASCAALAQSVDGFIGEFPAEWRPLQAGPVQASATIDFAVLNADAVALVVHTSGSTGTAQAIPKRLSQLSNEVVTLEAVFGSRLGDADIVATVSHQHIYGLLFKVLWPLTTGRAIHARSQNFPEELVGLLASRACILIASPAHLKRMPDHLPWSSAAHYVRAVFSSGGPLPADVAHATGTLLGQVPIEVYGSSETGGIAWRQRTRAADHAADESWLPLPQVEWRLIATNTEEDLSASENVLEIRSPHLPDDAWFRLADCAEACGAGRFMLTGRSDRIVKIEEKRISLTAIEALLAASDYISDVRVLMCDEVPGQRQRLASFLVLSEHGKSLFAAEGKLVMNGYLKKLLVDAIEPVALPRRWRYLDQLPLNAQGKTTHAMLHALLDERPRVPHARLMEQDLQRVALEIVVPPDLLYFDGHFTEAPILPGVVQLDWAISKGREYFDLPPRFHAVNALKFQRVIGPDQPVMLELIHDAQKGSLNFRYFSTAGQHASGRVLFVVEAVSHA